MLTLGIESSCDDTAASVVDESGKILSSVVSSQDDIHSKYGGIVPELASRRHIERIAPVVETALSKAGVTIDDVGLIGVTRGPGLVGSILIGLSFAKAVSFAEGIPFVGVNHLLAHPLAAFLFEDDNEKELPGFPFISLIVSGGHTSLLLFNSFTNFELLGQTRDDAAGEAFDKVAKLLGLAYPGGARIDALAKEGNKKAIPFKRSYLGKGSLDFSFSGIKTAVMNHLRSLKAEPTEDEKRDISASFQEAVVDVLVKKTLWAAEEFGVSDIVIAGGVACNSRLRERATEAANDAGLRLFIPVPRLCSDNGAMIAFNAFHLFKNDIKNGHGLELNAEPNWEVLVAEGCAQDE